MTPTWQHNVESNYKIFHVVSTLFLTRFHIVYHKIAISSSPYTKHIILSHTRQHLGLTNNDRETAYT